MILVIIRFEWVVGLGSMGGVLVESGSNHGAQTAVLGRLSEVAHVVEMLISGLAGKSWYIDTIARITELHIEDGLWLLRAKGGKKRLEEVEYFIPTPNSTF